MIDRCSEEVLAQVYEARTVLNSTRVRKHRWIGHVLCHDEVLFNLKEGRMVGKPTRGRRRLQMFEDLCENNSYKVLKRIAEDRSERRENTRRNCQNLLYSGQLKKKNGYMR